MPNIGLPELIVILLLLFLVFGASRLPALGEGMGKAIRSFKRGIAHNDDIEISKQESRKAEPVVTPPAPKRVSPESSVDTISDAEIVEDKKV